MRRRSAGASVAAFGGLAVLAAMVPAVTRDPYHIDVATTIIEGFLLTMSLRLVINLGLLNMGHISLMAVGAYASAALVMHLGLSFWLALPLASGAAALLALALGRLTLRVHGPYFFLVTFALLAMVRLFFHSFFEDVFGGASGLIGVPRPDPIALGGLTLRFAGKVPLYYLLLVVWIVVAAVFVRIEYSRLGMLFAAIQQSEPLARAVGVRTVECKLLALALSGVAAGAAGAFFAHSRGVINASDFGVEPMLRLLVFVVVGGVGSVWGPIAGTVSLSIVSEMLRDLRHLETFVYGAVLIATMRFFPEGLVGGLQRLAAATAPAAARIRGRRRYGVA